MALFRLTIDGRPGEARWLAVVALGLREGGFLGMTGENVDLNKKFINVGWQTQACV